MRNFGKDDIMYLQREGRRQGPSVGGCESLPDDKGVLGMTALFVFVALIAVNVAYSIRDARRTETARQMEDFYRVEYKKSYGVRDEEATMANGWY